MLKILALDNIWGEIVRFALEQEGVSIQVVGVKSERDALHRLQSECFDLLILDHSFPTGKRAESFLDKWRSSTKDTGVLTLMVKPKSAPSGFVRAPVQRNESHAYIRSLLGPKELVEMVKRLLAGASTQRFPGDEGYTRHKDKELNVVFDHPVFWTVHSRSPDKTDVFQRFCMRVLGPMNRYQGFYSQIVVSVYRPFEFGTGLEIEAVTTYEFGEWREYIQRVAPWREVQVYELPGEEAEYTWSKKDTVWTEGGDRGRTIMTMVRRDEKMYVLSLTAAEEGFDAFRPAYAHFLETFEFLD